jgi:hypothetical protein
MEAVGSSETLHNTFRVNFYPEDGGSSSSETLSNASRVKFYPGDRGSLFLRNLI